MEEITNKQLKNLAPIIKKSISDTASDYAINPEINKKKGVLNESEFSKLATHNAIKKIIKNRDGSNKHPLGG